jgi:hypothetical protein
MHSSPRGYVAGIYPRTNLVIRNGYDFSVRAVFNLAANLLADRDNPQGIS